MVCQLNEQNDIQIVGLFVYQKVLMPLM